MKQKITVVVTRHPALVAYLQKLGLVDESVQVLDHVSDPEILKGKNVCGVLPHNLSCLCETFTEIPLLNLPPELRGKEMSIEIMEKYAGNPVTYVVRKIEDYSHM